jgi:DNA-binding transcriptional MerR regulator
MKTYSSAEVRRLTGATLSDIQHWTALGLLKASAGDEQGKGRHRRFVFDDLVEIRIAVVLHGLGIRAGTIYSVLAYLRSLNPQRSRLFKGATRLSAPVRKAVRDAQFSPVNGTIRTAEQAISEQSGIDAQRLWQKVIDPARRGNSGCLLFLLPSDPVRYPQTKPGASKPSQQARSLAGKIMLVPLENDRGQRPINIQIGITNAPGCTFINLGQILEELEVAADGDDHTGSADQPTRAWSAASSLVPHVQTEPEQSRFANLHRARGM